MNDDATRSMSVLTRRTALLGLGIGALGLELTPRLRGVSAQDASPVATSFPRTGHPIIGAWQLDYEPWNPGRDTTYALFDADGTYVETR